MDESGVWLGGGGGEKIGGAWLFSLQPTKTLSPQIGEKIQKKTSHSFLDKTASRQHQHSTLCLLYHHTPLMQWSFHKYKYLWSVERKSQGSSLQEGTSHNIMSSFLFVFFHDVVSCSHFFLPSFYYRHYFLFCAHQFLLILVLGHCLFFFSFLGTQASFCFVFILLFLFFKDSDFFSIHDFYF